MTNPFQRPNPPKKANQNQSSHANTHPKKVITTRGNSGGNRNNNPPLPSPWLDSDNEPTPDCTASFVEYIRWMRSADHEYKDATKTQILQLATQNANYKQRLEEMNRRLTLMAGENNTFQVKSTWRIRVGGHRGAENILLPAFDNLGIPFIPSASLRGVARNQAIREVMQKHNLSYEKAEKHQEITKLFGSLDAEKENQAGKVVFFDAYPLPNQYGLAMDMANNIWKWEGNQLEYSPNPNVFLSLKEPTFLVGIKLVDGNPPQPPLERGEILERVKKWLIKGLESGIGSQINTGYGQLIELGKKPKFQEFLRVKFELEGQLIHGYQEFNQWNYNEHRNEWQMRGKAKPEVRPVAFKSMLRYWFKAFALGVLTVKKVQEWEGKLFGLIQPERYDGWVKFMIDRSSFTSESKDNCGEETGILTLSYVDNTPSNYETIIKDLFENLVWLMFYLGGVGQGARRPLYERNNNPRYRGSTLYINSPESWAKLPPELTQFANLCQSKIKGFYTALEQLTNQQDFVNNLDEFTTVTTHQWAEVIDNNCRIIIVSDHNYGNKSYALGVLHQQFHQLEAEMNKFKQQHKFSESKAKYSEMKSLCGGTNSDKIIIDDQKKERKAIPSPIWIRDLGRYQVVTVFGATANPRKRYLEELKNNTSPNNYAMVFPLS